MSWMSDDVKRWNSSLTYAECETVIYGGEIYRSLQDNNQGNQPDESSSTYWINMTDVQCGDDGDGSILSMTPFTSDPSSPVEGDTWLLLSGGNLTLNHYDGTDIWSVGLSKR